MTNWKFWKEKIKSFQEELDEFWEEFKPMETSKELLAVIIIIPFFAGMFLSGGMIKQLLQIGFTAPGGIYGLRPETIFVAAAMGIGLSMSAALYAIWSDQNRSFSEKANFIGFPIVVFRMNGQRITTDKRFGNVMQVFPTRRKVRFATRGGTLDE